jgi:gluconokinase
MLPYLLAERAPLWDPDVPGAYLGLRRRHGRAHLVRAAIEGVCLQLGSIVELLADTEPVRSVRATGGALRAPLWRDVLAASIGRPLRVVEDAGGSALGAAALALLALGRAPDLAGARALLVDSDRDDDLPAPVAVDPGLLGAAEATRSRLPSLLSAYGEVATLLGRDRHGGASLGEDRAPQQLDHRRSP